MVVDHIALLLKYTGTTSFGKNDDLLINLKSQLSIAAL